MHACNLPTWAANCQVSSLRCQRDQNKCKSFLLLNSTQQFTSLFWVLLKLGAMFNKGLATNSYMYCSSLTWLCNSNNTDLETGRELLIHSSLWGRLCKCKKGRVCVCGGEKMNSVCGSACVSLFLSLFRKYKPTKELERLFLFHFSVLTFMPLPLCICEPARLLLHIWHISKCIFIWFP